MYYKHKFVDRLEFAKVNYERSKRKSFQPYQFDLKKLEIIESNIPIFMEKDLCERAI